MDSIRLHFGSFCAFCALSMTVQNEVHGFFIGRRKVVIFFQRGYIVDGERRPVRIRLNAPGNKSIQ